MYYPFLRGLQFELIVLRELSKKTDLHRYVCPIIEPVRASLSSLQTATDTIGMTEWHPFLVLNPSVGDMVEDNRSLIDFYSDEACRRTLRPALIYCDNRDRISSYIDEMELNDVMIICMGEISDPVELLEVVRHPKVRSVVLLNPHKHRRLENDLKRLDKAYIRLDDSFVSEKKNADYLDVPPQKFTEQHLYYRDDGYDGYSDFTLLPMFFESGGWLPRAISIHWSYLSRLNDQEIWVRHFTSETNETSSNIQGKFAEAVAKLSDASRTGEEPLSHNDALGQMLDYERMKKYPGLGVIKKLSIMNHILINYQYLSGHGGEEVSDR